MKYNKTFNHNQMLLPTHSCHHSPVDQSSSDNTSVMFGIFFIFFTLNTDFKKKYVSLKQLDYIIYNELQLPVVAYIKIFISRFIK